MIKSRKWLLFFKGFYKKTYKIESDDVQKLKKCVRVDNMVGVN